MRFLNTASIGYLLALAALPACIEEGELGAMDEMNEMDEMGERDEPTARKLPTCLPDPDYLAEDCPGGGSYCGDNICNGDEDPDSCPQDCSFCGDGVCEGYEGSVWCPADCGAVCGDGVCNGPETIATCVSDCSPELASVELDRVRHCQNSFVVCNSAISRPEYNWWEHFGVANDKQKRTYLARAVNPARANVRHLVFLAAGQQSDVDDSDQPSKITGQNDTYKNAFSKTSATKEAWLDEDSLARRLVEEMHVDPDETFVGLAFDARFNHGFSYSNKQEIENAYYAWLKDKFFAENLESIYLGGHSRGGCLVMRLARRFNAEFPNVPLIVHVFDGVCKASQGELNLSLTTTQNPLDSVHDWSWTVDMNTLFTNTAKLRVLNIVSGAQVLSLGNGLGIRSFAHKTSSQEPVVKIGDWYEQRWTTEGHDGIGQSTYSVQQALSHRDVACQALGC